ncbi:MAG: PAS domain S-box protein [Verrucomicrobia bacterium]|nr:PAS domain S-box protein [Verrucomicrobiota bacterium]
MFDHFLAGDRILRRQHSPGLRYGIALFAVVLAAGVPPALLHWGGVALPYLSFYPAVILVTLFLGRGPGIVALIFSALAANYWIEPMGRILISSPVQIFTMGLFVGVSLLTVAVCHGLRKAMRRVIHAEEALKEMHRRETSALLESISDGFVALDREWRFVAVNAAAAKIWRKDGSDLLGKVLWDVFPEAEKLLFGREFRRAMAEKVSLKLEEFYPAPLSAWFEVRCYPAESGLSLFFTDVTERKATEQRLRQLSRAVEQSPSAVMITDAFGNIEYVNPKFTSLTGYSLEEAIGKNPNILKTGETSSGAYRELWSTIRSGREWRGEFHNRKKNGELFWESASICPINDENGVITHFIAIKEDITERKAVETALLEAKQMAERANQAKDDLIAALSHELRTPLTPALMLASALECDEALSRELRKDISLIRHNVELEARLIDDLLDITKITHGKFSIQPLPIDLNDLLARSLEIVRSDLLSKKITVQLDCPESSLSINADPARLQQVFWNILRNAVKFTPEEGSIRLRAFYCEPQTIVVEISDTGIGIAPEFLERVFEPFQQGGATGNPKYGGLGLGLAISKSIIEIHGGTITAASAGRGSTFTVRLPARPLETGSGPLPGPTVRGVSPLRILLVEDHEATRTTLTRLLTRDGHSVTSVGCCAAALETVLRQPADEPFQMLISDLGLPDGSGLDLVRTIKGQFPNLTAVALSGYGTDADIRKSTEAGFAKHLTKPINLQDLRRVLAA